jgi:hypothetical protein
MVNGNVPNGIPKELANFTAHHFEAEGKPNGGSVYGRGFTIVWQRGNILGDPDKINGAFIETIIAAAVSRLGYYQSTEFACPENDEAIAHLVEAVKILVKRSERVKAESANKLETESDNKV